MFAVFVLLALFELVTSLVTYDTCGTLLGDGRYCRNYASKDLSDLPNEGWNVTTILILSDNHISALHKEPFKHDSLLVEVDLRDNHIQYIDKHAFSGLPNLARVYLGNNRLHCDASICGFRDWLLINNNKNKVVDINNVKCLTPDRYKGSPILNLPNAACKNTSYDNAFEINTGTVFIIWIMVPVCITLVTAMYILINGGHACGRAIRRFWHRYICYYCCCIGRSVGVNEIPMDDGIVRNGVASGDENNAGVSNEETVDRVESFDTEDFERYYT